MITMIYLGKTLMFASNEICQLSNYEEEVSRGAGLLRSYHHWFETLQLIKELDQKHDAEDVYGHDPEQYKALTGWS